MKNSTLLLVLFLCFFFAINFVPSALAIWLTLPTSGTKCVSEEIQNNVVVLADYIVIPDDHSHNPTLAVKVPFFSSIRPPFSFFSHLSFFNFVHHSCFCFSPFPCSDLFGFVIFFLIPLFFNFD